MPSKRERVALSPKEIAALVEMHPATVTARARAGLVLAERTPGTRRGRWTVVAERSRVTGRWRLVAAGAAR